MCCERSLFYFSFRMVYMCECRDASFSWIPKNINNTKPSSLCCKCQHTNTNGLTHLFVPVRNIMLVASGWLFASERDRARVSVCADSCAFVYLLVYVLFQKHFFVFGFLVGADMMMMWTRTFSIRVYMLWLALMKTVTVKVIYTIKIHCRSVQLSHNDPLLGTIIMHCKHQ